MKSSTTTTRRTTKIMKRLINKLRRWFGFQWTRARLYPDGHRLKPGMTYNNRGHIFEKKQDSPPDMPGQVRVTPTVKATATVTRLDGTTEVIDITDGTTIVNNYHG